jgi:hypothetical protein
MSRTRWLWLGARNRRSGRLKLLRWRRGTRCRWWHRSLAAGILNRWLTTRLLNSSVTARSFDDSMPSRLLSLFNALRLSERTIAPVSHRFHHDRSPIGLKHPSVECRPGLQNIGVGLADFYANPKDGFSQKLSFDTPDRDSPDLHVRHFGHVEFQANGCPIGHRAVQMHLETSLIHIRGNSPIVGKLSRAKTYGRPDSFRASSTGTIDSGQGHLIGEFYDGFLALFNQAHTCEVFRALIHLCNLHGDGRTILAGQKKLELRRLPDLDLLGRAKAKMAISKGQRKDLERFTKT